MQQMARISILRPEVSCGVSIYRDLSGVLVTRIGPCCAHRRVYIVCQVDRSKGGSGFQIRHPKSPVPRAQRSPCRQLQQTAAMKGRAGRGMHFNVAVQLSHTTRSDAVAAPELRDRVRAELLRASARRGANIGRTVGNIDARSLRAKPLLAEGCGTICWIGLAAEHIDVGAVVLLGKVSGDQ